MVGAVVVAAPGGAVAYHHDLMAAVLGQQGHAQRIVRLDAQRVDNAVGCVEVRLAAVGVQRVYAAVDGLDLLGADELHALLLQLGQQIGLVEDGHLHDEVLAGQHIDDGDGFALLGQCQRAFQAGDAAAADHHVLSGLHGVAVHVPYGQRAVHAGDGGIHIDGAGGHDDGVGIFLLNERFGDGGVQHDLCTAVQGLLDVPVQIFPHELLEGHHAGVDEQTAQLVRLFVEGDGMAALDQRLGGHHAGGAAADDHNILTLGLGQLLDLSGNAAAGIDGAAHGGAVGVGVAAQVAAGAGAHFGALTGQRLVDDVAVSHEALGHGHDVRLAGGDDVLGLLQRGDHAHDSHGDMQVLFHLGGIVHVQRFVGLAEIGGDRVAGGEMEDGALGDVHDVHILLRQFHEGQRLLKFQTAGNALGGRDAQLDDHVAAHGLPNGLQHFQRILAPVFGTPAVFIGADVGIGGEPLGEEVVVGTVNQDHAEARVLAAHSAVHKVLLHLVHVGAVHGAHIVAGVQRTLGGDDGGGLTVGGSPVAAAGVGQLDGQLCAVLAALLHQRVHAVDAVVVTDIHLAQPVRGVVVGDRGIAHSDPAHAGLGLPLHEVQHILAHGAVGVALEYHGGGIFQPVFQGQPPDGNRLKYMGITICFHNVPPNCIVSLDFTTIILLGQKNGK